MNNGLSMSFWKLSPQRRCELVWDRVKQMFNAVRYVPKKKATAIEMYMPTSIYIYDVTIKSQTYIMKNFHSKFYEIGDSDHYTVVHIHIRPPFLKDGYTIYFQSKPVTIVSHRDSTCIATVAKSYKVSDVLHACYIPLTVGPELKYMAEMRGLLLTPENMARNP